MQQCPQTETQTVYQHGVSVQQYTLELIDILKSGKSADRWRLPNWIFDYRQQILDHLLPTDIIAEYTLFHDCGKPFCIQYDDNGKRHFLDHANKSAQIWLEVGGNAQVAKLMAMDMFIHTIKANEIDAFIQHPEAITLLIVGLSEVHSNAQMFGGIDSVSFKIKWKQINQRGKAICSKLFKEKQ
jgi:hypothetical protein